MKPAFIVVFALAMMTIAQAQRPSTPPGARGAKPSTPLGTSGTTLDLPLRITGTAISAGGFRNPTGIARVEIHLNRLSTPNQRDEFLQTLKRDGQEALLEKLRKASSVGTIRFDTNLAWDLRYATMKPGTANTVQVSLATDRPMSFAEVWNQPQYSDYPFTLINFELGPELKGKGTMILAAQISADETGRFVHVENYGSTPVQLNDLQAEVGH